MLEALASQDYEGEMEIVIGDGSDTLQMAELVRREHPNVVIVPNPGRIVSSGVNVAILKSTGEIIVRCDAQCLPSRDYVRRAVNTLERTGAANVGSYQKAVGVTFIQRSIAMALTTPLGGGFSRFRVGGEEGAARAAYLGTFRRETFDEVGPYDTSLTLSEDYEFNQRLRKLGKTVWFDPELVMVYRPRKNLLALARQFQRYGRWKAVMIMEHPASIRMRHVLAFGLMLGLVAIGVLGGLTGNWWPLVAMALAYCVVVAGTAVVVGCRRRSSAALLLPLALLTMHFSWGAGFVLPARIPNRRRPPASTDST